MRFGLLGVGDVMIRNGRYKICVRTVPIHYKGADIDVVVQSHCGIFLAAF